MIMFNDHEYAAAAEAVLTPENRFHAAALAGRTCFLTGMAGTGKSTLLRGFVSESLRRVDITAPTGVAEGHSIRTPTSQATARSRVRVTQRVRLQRRRSNTQRVQRARCSERAADPDTRPPATAAR